MGSIASAFSKPPNSWGYRGDPYLWDALGWQLSAKISQTHQNASPHSLETLLTETFRELIEDGDWQGDGVALSWLPEGGMSGGIIHYETWTDRLLPEIAQRIHEIRKAPCCAIEYHPAEHRFRFAAWAAATASQNCRNVSPFEVSATAKLLQMSDLRWLSLGSHWLPLSRKDFDRAHNRWCEKIMQISQDKYFRTISYGMSAKLINCYLKALFLQTMSGLPFDLHSERSESVFDNSTRFIHPPIDSVLMMEAAHRSDAATKKSWERLIEIGWSNFTSRDYQDALHLCRETVGNDVLQLEAYWNGF